MLCGYILGKERKGHPGRSSVSARRTEGDRSIKQGEKMMSGKLKPRPSKRCEKKKKTRNELNLFCFYYFHLRADLPITKVKGEGFGSFRATVMSLFQQKGSLICTGSIRSSVPGGEPEGLRKPDHLSESKCLASCSVKALKSLCRFPVFSGI